MTETETNFKKPITKSSTHKDGISKWYTIFAVFLAVNFCCLSYAYWVKFYKNKPTVQQADSLMANVIVLPPDTVYVDKEELDSLNDDATIDKDDADTDDDADVVDNNSKNITLPVKPSTNNQNTQVSKNTAPVKSDAVDNNKSTAAVNKPVAKDKGIGKTEDEGHTFLVSLGMFKSKANALSLIADLKQKGIEGEMEVSDHFSKMAPGYFLVLAGRELSSATAYQIGADMKKKGLDYFVKDAGKYSWR